ncbi:MAG: flagellar hook-basal body complex protein [Alphaproteobacteria bacterium]|nr:flagellar hook-basal body complex protein [Alphaproteobacteria bacterium]
MDNAGYVNLTRQSGLLKEMQTIANNIANLSTTGYRREGVIFSEFIRSTGPNSPSLSFADGNGRLTDTQQGALDQTNGKFDFAIEGPGFFVLSTPRGNRLTRAGAFSPNDQGDLVSMDGFRVLDSGGAPIFVPPDAKSISLAPDGTLSADGNPLAQVGVVTPDDLTSLIREGGVMFRTSSNTSVVENPKISQGFLEKSNVSPVSEMSRMIEVQRSYELGQKFLEREDQRIRSVVRILGQ